MSNTKNNDKPSTPPAIAPLSSEIGRNWRPASESFDIRKSHDTGHNTIRNTHPAPGNPDRNESGGNKDSK